MTDYEKKQLFEIQREAANLSMALALLQEKLVDLYNGQADLKNGYYYEDDKVIIQ